MGPPDVQSGKAPWRPKFPDVGCDLRSHGTRDEGDGITVDRVLVGFDGLDPPM
jgi:hypothetical protein